MGKHDTATKLKALTVAEMVGSRAASEAIGVPLRTVQGWRQQGRTDPEVAALVRRATTRAKEELVVEAGEMLADLAAVVHANIHRMAEAKESLSPSQLRDLSVTAGIWTDKMSDLQGREAGGIRFGHAGFQQPIDDGPSPMVRELLEGLGK